MDLRSDEFTLYLGGERKGPSKWRDNEGKAWGRQDPAMVKNLEAASVGELRGKGGWRGMRLSGGRCWDRPGQVRSPRKDLSVALRAERLRVGE